MSKNGSGQELGSVSPQEMNCRLLPLSESLQRNGHLPPECLGVVACNQCLGVFNVKEEFDPKSEHHWKITVDNPGHVSCKFGFSNNPEAHLDETSH